MDWNYYLEIPDVYGHLHDKSTQYLVVLKH